MPGTDLPGKPRIADPGCFVIFGASGDLTRRLLLPALYNLVVGGLLPESFALLGVARRDLGDAGFRVTVREAIQGYAKDAASRQAIEWLESRAHYLAGDFDDPSLYDRMWTYLVDPDAAQDVTQEDA